MVSYLLVSPGALQLKHINVRSQLPYALAVGSVTMLPGDFLTAYGLNPFIAILLIFAALYLILMLVGKKV